MRVADEWGDALKAAWLEMVALICDRYDTTYEYANMIVGTIGDARPGFATGYMGGYATCQIAVTKKAAAHGRAVPALGGEAASGAHPEFPDRF